MTKKVLLWSLTGALIGSVGLAALIDEGSARFRAEETPTKQCVCVLFGTEKFTGSDLVGLNATGNSFYTLNNDSDSAFGIASVERSKAYRKGNSSFAVRLGSASDKGTMGFTFNGSYVVSSVKITAYAYATGEKGQATFALSNGQSMSINSENSDAPTIGDDADAASDYIFTLSNSGATPSTGFNFTGVAKARLSICKIVLTLNGGTPSSSSASSASSDSSSSSASSSSSSSSSSSASSSSTSSSASSGSSSSSVPTTGGTYSLVTSSDALVAGKKYVIGNSKDGGTASLLGNSQISNYWSAAVNGIINGDSSLTPGSDTEEIVLGGADSAWTLTTTKRTSNGYLVGNASYTSLLVEPAPTSYFTYKITIDGAGAATIQNNDNSKYINYYSAYTEYQLSPTSSTVYLFGEIASTGTAPSLSISPSTLSLIAGGSTGSVTASTDADATLSASSTNPTVASVALSGSVITVTPLTAGTSSINVISTNSSSSTTRQCSVTVTAASNDPTAIVVSPSTLSLSVGATSTLSYALTPSDASTTVSWVSSNPAVATVSATGVVTAASAGSASITASTSNGLSSSCTLSVAAAPVSTGDYELVSSASDLVIGDSYVFACNSKKMTATTISNSVMGYVESTFSTDLSTISTLGAGTVEMNLGGSADAYTFTYDTKLLGCTAVKKLAWGSGTTTWKIALSSSNADITSTNSSYGTLRYNTQYPRFTTYVSGQTAIQLYHKSNNPVFPTAIELNHSTLDLGINETSNLLLTYTPTTTNQKNVTWTSSAPTIASVSSSGVVSGLAAGSASITASVTTEGTPLTVSCAVTVKTISVTGVSLSRSSAEINITKTVSLSSTIAPSNATNQNITWSTSAPSIASVNQSGLVTGLAVGSSTITATTADGGKQASCVVNVTAIPQAAWTIMFYMCGADLESGSGLATGDLTEIKSVTGQPSNVNIVFEAGGASSWSSTYSSVINANNLNRFHLSNGSYVKDAQIAKANMGLTSTFQSFLEWGLDTYPAERTMVVMWDHGGAMRGCCYDENYGSDSLLNSEVKSALTGAFASTNQSSKLEVIGYDACLMQVQDIAEFDSAYFNYMVASEESESGYGWDYDGGWLTSIYNSPSVVATSTVLTSVADTFVADNGGVSSASNDQTLSWLDLNNMAAYKTAWESMAYYLNSSVLTSSNKTSFQTLVKSCKTYCVDTDSSQYYFAIIDVSDFLTKLLASTTFNKGSVSTYVSAVQAAFSNLVKYSTCGAGAGNSYGLCMFFSVRSDSEQTSVYVASETNFTNWITTNRNFGV